MSLLERTKRHYEKLRGDACLQAGQALRELGLDVRVMNLSRRSLEAVKEQWGDARNPEASWDWDQILRTYGDMKSLAVALWTPEDRLVAVGMATLRGSALSVRFVEGDPSADCEFKGKRVAMVLEVATRYAQMAGATELRIQPLNDALAHLYESVYGFTLVSKKGEVPYWRLEV